MPVYRHIQALVKRSTDNFPVGSLLFPRHARKEILHFYAFARNADNIADHEHILPEEKLRLLESLRIALGSGNQRIAPDWAKDHIADVDKGKTSAKHGLALISAFMQDVRQSRYVTYDDLVDYSQRSAVPVGRVVLELCHETEANLPAADALCIVLQLLNHLRDCGKDYRELKRIYLPSSWLYQCSAREKDLAADASTDALRGVYRLYLSECALLLAKAAPLIHSIKSPRLKMELSLTFELAMGLYQRLRDGDPLAGRITLPVWSWPIYLFKGIRRLW